jgi:hypothetical protein
MTEDANLGFIRGLKGRRARRFGKIVLAANNARGGQAGGDEKYA